jgi:splicing factor 1
MARDCFQRNGPGGAPPFGAPGGAPGAPGAPKTAFDSEYANLMAELGEGGSGAASGPAIGMITNGSAEAGGAPAQKIPPWRIPENWFSNSESECVFFPILFWS